VALRNANLLIFLSSHLLTFSPSHLLTFSPRPSAFLFPIF
jgi:hypothetical protein